MIRVFDIDFSVSKNDFKTIAEDVCANKCSGNVKYSSEDLKSMQGKSLVKHTLLNTNTQFTTEFLCEDDGNGNLVFKKFGIISFNNTWYKVSSDDSGTDLDSPSIAMLYILSNAAVKNSGKFLAEGSNGSVFIVKDGDKMPADKGKICIEVENTIYGTGSNVQIDSEAMPQTSHYKYKLPSWLGNKKTSDKTLENILLKTAGNVEARMILVGKYLITEKVKGAIEQDEFHDIFMQCASLCSGFSSDNTLSIIYRLLQ